MQGDTRAERRLCQQRTTRRATQRLYAPDAARTGATADVLLQHCWLARRESAAYRDRKSSGRQGRSGRSDAFPWLSPQRLAQPACRAPRCPAAHRGGRQLPVLTEVRHSPSTGDEHNQAVSTEEDTHAREVDVGLARQYKHSRVQSKHLIKKKAEPSKHAERHDTALQKVAREQHEWPRKNVKQNAPRGRSLGPRPPGTASQAALYRPCRAAAQRRVAHRQWSATP